MSIAVDEHSHKRQRDEAATMILAARRLRTTFTAPDDAQSRTQFHVWFPQQTADLDPFDDIQHHMS